MTEALTWSRLEDAIAVLPAWRRIGREWHGPCPVTGVGQHTCWFAAGDRAEIPRRLPPLRHQAVATDFISHVDALVGRTSAPPSFSASGPSAVGGLSASASRGSLGGGETRFARHSGVSLLGPFTVASSRLANRFLPRSAGSRPPTPSGSTARLPSPVPRPVPWSIVSPLPGRLSPLLCSSRPSQRTGRRFLSASWASGRPLPVRSLTAAAACLSPPSAARAVAAGWSRVLSTRWPSFVSARSGSRTLQGASVFGVAGAPAGFQLRACSVSGTVVLAPDPDPAGDLSVLRLGAVLASLHRSYRVRRPVPRMDWSDMALEASLEQEMLHERPA